MIKPLENQVKKKSGPRLKDIRRLHIQTRKISGLSSKNSSAEQKRLRPSLDETRKAMYDFKRNLPFSCQPVGVIRKRSWSEKTLKKGKRGDLGQRIGISLFAYFIWSPVSISWTINSYSDQAHGGTLYPQLHGQ